MFRIFSQYVSQKAYLFFAADFLSGLLSILLATYLRILDPEARDFAMTMPDFGYRIAVVLAVFLVCAYYNDVYTQSSSSSVGEQLFRLAQAVGVACFALATLYFLAPQLRLGRGVFVLSVVLMLMLAFGHRWLTDRLWRSAAPKTNIALIGLQELAQTTAREITHRADLNMRVVGFIDTAGGSRHNAPDLEILGGVEDLDDILQTYKVQKLIVAVDESEAVPTPGLLRARTRGVVIEDARAMLAALTGKVAIETIPSSWFIFSEGFRRSRYTAVLKRLLDLSMGLVGLTLSMPVMVVVGLCVKLESKGPMLFRQQRVGLEGECFELMKFRTMRQDAEADGVARWAQKNDPRITRIGGFLRKYRFDELPQFVNVIRGEMSMVGPRPERPEFVERLRAEIPFYDERHTMRPGITGWAQICYPYGATVEDALRKLEYDLFYLKNVSIFFDVAIALQTVKIVLWGRGQ